MHINQRTIKNAHSLSGVGLHTGQNVTLTFKPAPTNHGVKFKRIDLDGEPIINADADLVTSVERGTTLEKNGVKIATVEHMMSALVGLQIDNIMVEMDGEEVPILDGSAKFFLEALEDAGIEDQDDEKEVYELQETIYYKDKETGVEMLAMPSDNYKLTALIDYKSDVLGQQHASIDDISEFKNEIGDARTFCFLHELEHLLQADLIKGGDLNNAIVVVDRPINEVETSRLAQLFQMKEIKVDKAGILNNVTLRHNNEPARHKLLDIVGDLGLVGYSFNAQIIATKPGHKSNIEFAKKIKSHIKKVKQEPKVPKIDVNQEPIYNLTQIEKLLPHRYPFLLVDRIIEMTDKHVVGIKNVTFNEPYFIGHFPGNPVMPGVLQIEALAQTGGVFMLHNVDDPENYKTYFLKIDQAKFKALVTPGDTLILKAELTGPPRRGIVEMKGTIFVGKKIVTEAILTARVFKD